MRQLYLYFFGLLIVTATNPAAWICAALGLLLYSNKWWLFTAFSIGFSHFAILQALSYRHCLKNAMAAGSAFRAAAENFEISITSLEKLIGKSKIDSLQIYGPLITICRLRAKPGVKPITRFKSYIMAGDAIIFISANSELTTFDRFYLLHEVSHSSGPAEALHHNMHSVTARLLPIYLPLCLLANSWIVGIVLVGVFIAQKQIEEENEPLLERETDWRAWTAYAEIYGREEAIAACKKLDAVFRMKARLEPSDKVNSRRAELSRKFRLDVERNSIRADKPLQMHLHSGGSKERISVMLPWFAGAVSLVSAIFFGNSLNLGPLTTLGVIAMWIGIVSRSYFEKRYGRESEALRVATTKHLISSWEMLTNKM